MNKTDYLLPIVIGADRDCSALSKNFHLKNSKNYHKFSVLKGALYSKEQVLSSILNHVSPNYLLPIEYETTPSGDASFLSSQCWKAIQALINSNFMVPIDHFNVQLEIKICLEFKKAQEVRFELSDYLQSVIRKRLSFEHKSGYKMLDLSNIEKDEGLAYFPLWAPKFQRHLVQYLKPTVLHLTHINLSHNNITSLYQFSRMNCPELEELNLSHNQIDWSDFMTISPQSVKVLWLEGNPLCKAPFPNYVNRLKALYPLLIKLDGVTLLDGETPYIMKNCFIDSSSHTLVDQFLHHYFMWFSKIEGRSSMVHMYNKEASISVSCNLDPTDFSFPLYKHLSRNILKISNYGKSLESFQSGLPYITFVLSSLPLLQIDPSTTTVDVPYYVENKVIQICMAGIFRDSNKKMFWIGFTFILQASETYVQEWKIVNQMITINSATLEQTKGAFRDDMKKLDMTSFEPTKKELLSQFKDLTNLNPAYCQQFLEGALWDLERALQSFVDQYKGDLVSEDAFITS